MEVVNTMEINGEEREIADAYAREQCAANAEGIDNLNSNLVEQKMLGWTVPSECPIQNEVNGNQFIQKVGRVDLGSLDWYYAVNRFYTVLEGGKHTSNYNGVDAYCDKYNNAKDKDHSTFDNKEFSIGSNFASNSTCAIVIRDDSYTNESAFKNAMQGEYLYYELETPITMTIDGNEAITKVKNDLSAVQSNTILNYESTTVDLDSLTGHPLIASVNTGATNAPTGFGGGYMIVVYAGSSSAALYQTLVDVVKNETYRRSLYHGSWSDWSLTAQ